MLTKDEIFEIMKNRGIKASFINNLICGYRGKMTGQAIYKHFVRTLAKHNLPHMRFHDLRHLNASIMLKLGVSDKYAMERGGWATNNIMKSVYQQTLSDERIAIDNKIDDYFNTIVATKVDTILDLKALDKSILM